MIQVFFITHPLAIFSGQYFSIRIREAVHYRNESAAPAIRMDVQVDGKPLGQTAAKTFFYTEVSPGKHTVTSISENTDTVEVDAVGGKLYYIWQEVKFGFLYARTKLHLVNDAEGQKGVLECQLAAQK